MNNYFDSNTKKLRLNERGTKTQKNVQNYKRMDSRIAKETAQWSHTHSGTLFQGAKLVRNWIKTHISGKTKTMWKNCWSLHLSSYNLLILYIIKKKICITILVKRILKKGLWMERIKRIKQKMQRFEIDNVKRKHIYNLSRKITLDFTLIHAFFSIMIWIIILIQTLKNYVWMKEEQKHKKTFKITKEWTVG